MTSAMRRGFAKFTSSDDSSKGQAPDKYRLLVTAGPSYDTAKHQIVPVNGDQAITIENDFITAKVKVRVRGYRGLPSGSPAESIYFDDPIHERDQYSLAFSFVPKQDLPSLDTVWGNDFDHPIRDRLPPGFNTAFKIVKEFIDPGLACDAYADEPWLYGPSLSCWFAFRIGDKVDSPAFPAPNDQQVMQDGADGTGTKVRQDLGMPDNNEKRRKFYLDAKNRKALVFEKGRLYQADFYNPYLDFGNLALKLPGFSLKVYKYIDNKSHCLRYVFKNRESGDMYLNVNFNLLWGAQLDEALENEKNHAPGLTARPEGKSNQVSGASTKAEDEQKPWSGPSDMAQDKSIVAGAINDHKLDGMTENSQQTPSAAMLQTEAGGVKARNEDVKASSVTEIEQLLASTSTGDRRGVETSILDVD